MPSVSRDSKARPKPIVAPPRRRSVSHRVPRQADEANWTDEVGKSARNAHRCDGAGSRASKKERRGGRPVWRGRRSVAQCRREKAVMSPKGDLPWWNMNICPRLKGATRKVRL
jgi:hypothetical protein